MTHPPPPLPLHPTLILSPNRHHLFSPSYHLDIHLLPFPCVFLHNLGFLCFPPQFGVFPFPCPSLPTLTTLSPPSQGPNLCNLPNPVPALVASPIFPSLKTSQNTPPITRVHGGSKRSFHIDAKLFFFSFDGGRFDSYAIHENRRNVRSSIWVGRRGMEWIISCFSDIWDWPGQDVLCKRFKEYGKLIEFCGRSNNVGLFVVIAQWRL